jgi:hypothetical protein
MYRVGLPSTLLAGIAATIECGRFLPRFVKVRLRLRLWRAGASLDAGAR